MAIRGGFEIATAYVELILDKDEAKRGLKNLPRDLGPDADRGGQHVGNIIARGIRLSMIRNSPLIAAAIAGALAAGAPAILGAASLLMAGIGAVAATQSQRVQSAWVGTWQNIKRGAIEDARVLVPSLVGMASRIGDAFEGMRPRLRDAFGDLAPQLDTLTTSITRTADTLVGGLVRAVDRAGPVMTGLGTMLERTATGFAAALDAMASHSTAAGSAAASLGTVLGGTLAVLGELLGIGAEIAAVMLPALGGSLNVVLGALRLMGPFLPAIVTGFAGFRMAQVAAGHLTTFAQSLAFASYGSGPFAGAMGKASTAVYAVGRALPVIGVAIGVVATAMQTAENRTSGFAQAILKGGEASARAYQQMANPGFWDKFLFNLTHWGNTQDVATAQTQEAEKAARDYVNSLTPLGRAQHEAGQAQTVLNEALDKYGVGSAQANRAQGAFEAASRRVEEQLRREEAQLRGVTEAMIEMADQANARANSDIAYRRSVHETEDAINALNEAHKSGTATAAELDRLNLDIEDSYIRRAEAAGKLAFDALPALMDEEEKGAAAARASLKELDALAAKYGGLPPNLETYRQSLLRIAGGMDTAKLDTNALSAALREMGMTVTSIPGTKEVKITAPTDAVVTKLRDLGFTVEQIPGTRDVVVTAETDEAKANVGNLAALLEGVDGTVAKTSATFDDQVTAPIRAILGGIFPNLARAHARPTGSLDDTALRSTYASDIGYLTALGNQRPTPVTSINDGPLRWTLGSDLAMLANLGNQRPTPVAFLNSGPFANIANWMFGTVDALGNRRPTPIATLIANTGGAEWALNWAARNRTSYVTQIARQVISWLPGGAGGGNVGAVARGFAGGGTPQRRSDGRLVGPGGPLDDLITAITNTGELIRVANTEWIINGAVSSRQGADKMAALNAGQADIVVRRPPVRAFADGGPPTDIRTDTQAVTAPAGTKVSVGELHLHLEGTFDFSKPADMRRLGQVARAAIIGLDREQS